MPLIAPFTDDAATGDTIDITAFSFTPNAQAPLTTATAVAELAFFDYGLSDEQAAALGASAPPDAAPAPDAALPGDSPAAPIAIALSDAAGNAAVFTDSRDTRAYADSFAAPGCEFADNAHASPDVIYRLAPDADATVAVTVCSVPSPNAPRRGCIRWLIRAHARNCCNARAGVIRWWTATCSPRAMPRSTGW